MYVRIPPTSNIGYISFKLFKTSVCDICSSRVNNYYVNIKLFVRNFLFLGSVFSFFKRKAKLHPNLKLFPCVSYVRKYCCNCFTCLPCVGSK